MGINFSPHLSLQFYWGRVENASGPTFRNEIFHSLWLTLERCLENYFEMTFSEKHKTRPDLSKNLNSFEKTEGTWIF